MRRGRQRARAGARGASPEVPKGPPFSPKQLTTSEIKERVKDLFAGILEKYPGWDFSHIKRLTLRQIADIILRQRAEDAALGVGGEAADPFYGKKAIREDPGPPSLEKDLKDLFKVKCVFGDALANYDEAREAIIAKWAKLGVHPTGHDGATEPLAAGARPANGGEGVAA